MAVLVTGGAGYIGSFVTRALTEQGRDVIVLDDLSKGHRRAVPEGVPLLEMECGASDRVAEAKAGHGIEAAPNRLSLGTAFASVRRRRSG